jgi:glycosyltransferase involved in cell wall biosynthesis
MSDTKDPVISVVITTYNDDRRLELTLCGFSKQKTSTPYEVIVVDDGGTSEARWVAKTWKAKYAYLFPPSPDFRLAKARNLGLQHTCVSSQRTVICDCDTVPASDFIEKHALIQRKIPQCVAVGLRKRIGIQHIEGEDKNKLLTINHIEDGLLESLVYEQDARVVGDRAAEYQSMTTNPRAWSVCWGCNFSAPTNAFLNLGGFDEEFIGWGGEDEDMAERFYRCGLPLVPLNDCFVYHLDHHARTQAKAAQVFARKLGGPLVRNGNVLRRIDDNLDRS